jgi:ribonuclease HI
MVFSLNPGEVAQMKQQAIRIFVDGSGADPNGMAGFAWLREGQKPHVEWGHSWTNNEAEYRGVLSAVKSLPEGTKATILCDSELVVRQLRGEYEVREPRLWDLHADIETVIFNNVLRITWMWISRKENKADRLLRQKPKPTEQSPCIHKETHRTKSQAKAR